MTTTTKQVVGARTALAYNSTDLSTLVTGTYVRNTTAYDCTANQPLDVIVEVAITPGTVSGNKQAVVFVQESIDGTNYRTGPYSSTTTTDEPNLRFLGTIPLNTNSTLQRATFSVAQALGYCPAKFYIVVKNDSGASFTTGTVYTSEIVYTSA
jgi:hypothetical protein